MTEAGDKYILSDWYVTDFSNGYHHIVVKDRSSGIISIKVETTYYGPKLRNNVKTHSFFIDRRTLNSIFMNYYLSRLIWNVHTCKKWITKQTVNHYLWRLMRSVRSCKKWITKQTKRMVNMIWN